MSNYPTVFVITPFGEDFLALYNELSKKFEKILSIIMCKHSSRVEEC